MESTIGSLTDVEIRELREDAKSAEPYEEGDEFFEWFDGELTPEEAARMTATTARDILKRHGIPLEE